MSSCSTLLNAQELHNIVPPAPNAASLAQYADTPVSNYTGIPNISVPLYNVSSGDIQFPISLNYYAQGIKVAQEASWVGLGWSLNAGGVITRQIRGKDDFNSFGYVFTGALPPADAYNRPVVNDPTHNDYYYDVNVGTIDSEPDIFYYNFMGYSGKLIFEKQSGSNILYARSIDQNNLIFSYNTITQKWTVTDGNGWEYSFGTAEIGYSHGKVEDSDSSGTTYFPVEFIKNTWYIDYAETPKGEKIEFKYTDNNLNRTVSQSSFSELEYTLVEQWVSIVADGNNTISIPGGYRKITENWQEIHDKHLDSIKFKNGYIKFNLEDRLDMKTGDLSTPESSRERPQRLESMEMFSLHGKPIKKVKFNYSYFNSNMSLSSNSEDYLRLKLDSVQELFNNLEKPAYKFTYNSTELPEKESYSVDHWGFYNNYNNNNIAIKSQIPVNSYLGNSSFLYISDESNSSVDHRKELIPFSAILGQGFISGANRETNTNYTKASILEKVEYPTGGSVEYEYEPNDYYREVTSMPFFNYSSKTAFAAYAPTLIQSTDTIVLTGHAAHVELQFVAAFMSSDPNQSLTLEHISGQLKEINNNVVVKFKPGEQYTNSFSKTIDIALPTGTYVLEVDNNGYSRNDFYIYLNASYREATNTDTKQGGGLRIRSISTKDTDSEIIKKKIFDYKDDYGNSTGRLMAPPSYYYNTAVLNTSIHHPNFSIGNYLVGNSNSVTPIGTSAQGNPIGYDRVTVSDVDALGNTLGNSKYYYKNEAESIQFNSSSVFIPNIPNIINLENGLLTKEEHFNDQGILLKQKDISYEKASSFSLKGLKAYSVYTNQTGYYFNHRFYDIFSEWWHPTQETETVYNLSGQNPITTLKTYEYANPSHKNITKTTLTNSKGEDLTSLRKYPSDYPTSTGISTTVFDRMVSDNILNPVIVEDTKLYSDKIGTTVNEFIIDPNDNIVVNTIKTSKGSGNLQDRIVYEAYNDQGNPLQVKKADGTSISYIWGYSEQYPVAKIENATYAQAVATLTSSELLAIKNGTYNQTTMLDKLNKIRTGLSAAMVTTYTYDPLIGVTSITDPKGYTIYYEYDEFNRLKQVKDADGNILSKNDYHYKGQ